MGKQAKSYHTREISKNTHILHPVKGRSFVGHSELAV